MTINGTGWRTRIRIAGLMMDDRVIILIGHARDGTPLEIGVAPRDSGDALIIHALRASSECLR